MNVSYPMCNVHCICRSCMFVCILSDVYMYVLTTQQACLKGYHAVLSVGEAPCLDFLLLCEGDGTCLMVCH